MSDDFDDLRLAARLDFAVDALGEIDCPNDELPAPAFVPQAVAPEWRAGKGAVWICTVADEAAGGVCIHGQEERNEQVVAVPESLEALRPDLRMRRRVHDQHA